MSLQHLGHGLPLHLPRRKGSWIRVDCAAARHQERPKAPSYEAPIIVIRAGLVLCRK